MRAQDETALSVDMGLMWAFDVDARGFPTGCPGLHTFFPSSDRFSDFTCGIDGRPWFVNPSLSQLQRPQPAARNAEQLDGASVPDGLPA